MRIGRFFHCKSSKKSLKKLPEEVPFVCLAIPLDEPCKGLAFAHLPLPLETGLSDLLVKSGFPRRPPELDWKQALKPRSCGLFDVVSSCGCKVVRFLFDLNHTGLPVHLHAGFALQDNRRGIWHRAAYLDGQHETWADWNEYILEDVAPHVYGDALKTLQAAGMCEHHLLYFQTSLSANWLGQWHAPNLLQKELILHGFVLEYSAH